MLFIKLSLTAKIPMLEQAEYDYNRSQWFNQWMKRAVYDGDVHVT